MGCEEPLTLTHRASSLSMGLARPIIRFDDQIGYGVRVSRQTLLILGRPDAH